MHVEFKEIFFPALLGCIAFFILIAALEGLKRLIIYAMLRVKKSKAPKNNDVIINASPQEVYKDKERNWETDYQFENGNYMTQCIICKHYFFGHKYRVRCRKCEGKR